LFATAISLSLLGSCGGLLIASSFLLFTDSLRTRLIPWLVSEALTSLSAPRVFATLLVGILVFFVLEKLMLLRHSHTDDHEVHAAAASLVLIGDAFHNFIDGAIICAAVLSSVPLGINTAIAVAAHEIPQEVGDVAILLAAGYSRLRALLLNILSGLSGVLGAIIAFVAVDIVPGIRPYVLAFSSASLLYIAMSDLIPDLHRREIDRSSLRQVLLISAGIGTIVLFERVVGP
jgi:zinc and cadmium transporter